MPSPAASPRELAQTWHGVLGRLEFELSPHNYRTWLEGTRPVGMEGKTLVVEATRGFGCDWLNGTLMPTIQRALGDVAGPELSVRFIAPGGERRRAESDERAAPQTTAGLNCEFTFERYITGAGNRMALAACRGVAEGPEPRISPVVVFGRPGMGKTHLLHATACAAAAAGWPVAYISAEEFTNAFQRGIKDGSLERLQERLRGVRLLAFDDLQYLVGKVKTAEELVHTLDAVRNAGGHCLFASEEDPASLDLIERLKSRLTSGVVAEVRPFGRDERKAFLEQTATVFRASLPAWAAERIVSTEMPSIRAVQGAVHGAIALLRGGELSPERLDLELARTALRTGAARCDPSKVVEAVARRFEVAATDVAGRSRAARVCEARAVTVYLLRERGLSLAEAGRQLGGRSRATMTELASRGKEIVEGEPGLRRSLAG